MQVPQWKVNSLFLFLTNMILLPFPLHVYCSSFYHIISFGVVYLWHLDGRHLWMAPTSINFPSWKHLSGIWGFLLASNENKIQFFFVNQLVVIIKYREMKLKKTHILLLPLIPCINFYLNSLIWTHKNVDFLSLTDFYYYYTFEIFLIKKEGNCMLLVIE